jgi:hypothetical protein
MLYYRVELPDEFHIRVPDPNFGILIFSQYTSLLFAVNGEGGSGKIKA